MDGVNLVPELSVIGTRVRVDLPDIVHEVAREDAQNGHHKCQENKIETCTPAATAARRGKRDIILHQRDTYQKGTTAYQLQ